jgi:hypothetical protein
MIGVWVTANRTAHAELMKDLHGDSKALSTSNGQVVLSVVPLLRAGWVGGRRRRR